MCAIIVVISGIVLIDNNKFGGEVTLENLAYDIALSVRQAQVYGIAVQRFGTSNFTISYGMQFSTLSPTTYVLFGDTEGTGLYDAGASPSEVVNTTDITQGYVIASICAISQVGGSQCVPVTTADILFKRPEPNAYISVGTNGNPPVSCPNNLLTACYYSVQITLESPKQSTRTVEIDETGQIAVQQTTTNP